MPEDYERRRDFLSMGLATYNINGGDATLWEQRRYDKRWHDDAAKEANGDGPDARRREIIFAVCLAESHLFEWVAVAVERDHPGAREFVEEHWMKSVSDKWRLVPKTLAEVVEIGRSGIEDRQFRHLQFPDPIQQGTDGSFSRADPARCGYYPVLHRDERLDVQEAPNEGGGAAEASTPLQILERVENGQEVRCLGGAGRRLGNVGKTCTTRGGAGCFEHLESHGHGHIA